MRDYAREHGLDTGAALSEGMAEKAKQFRETGGEVYVAGANPQSHNT